MTAAIDYDLWSGSATPRAVEADAPLRPRLTAHPVDGGTGRPALVVLPGGGYAGQADHEGAPVARWLGSLGIGAFVLSYRVHPDLHPLPLLDARRAVRFVRRHAAHWQVDPARVGVLGFSAGGHLAACVATGVEPGSGEQADEIGREEARPSLAVLCYPVISFEQSPHVRSIANLLGPNAGPSLRRRLSAELQVDAATPPSFLWHTADDPGVDVAHSLLYARALSERGVPVELHVFPHGGHGLGLAAGDPHAGGWTELCRTWLRSHGWTH